MLSFSNRKKILYEAGEWAYLTCSVGFVFLGTINTLKLDEAWLTNRPLAISFISRIQELSFWGYALLSLIVTLSFIIRKTSDPWVVEKIKFILDEYQGKAFTNNHNQTIPRDHNRVTLFKYKKRCLFIKHWSSKNLLKPWGNKPPFSNYLVPVLRSGHISQKTKIAFYAPDDSDKAEGVAARAWASNRAITITDLPHITPSCRQRDISTYASRTFSNIDMIKKYQTDGRELARSIVAIPVETNGNIWGALVLDSRDPNGLTDNAVDHYRLTVALIGKLLEKA